MSKSSRASTEAELAKHYQESRDVSEFAGEGEPVEVRRNVTISVRFSEEEISLLRARAEQADLKVTAFIRAAALEQDAPIDRAALMAALRKACADMAHAERLLGA